MRLAIRLHKLAGHPTRAPEFFLPASKPVLFDYRSLRIRQVGLGVLIHKESDRKHVAIGGLVSDALACIALHRGQEGATAFVRAGKSTLRRARGSASSTIDPSIISSVVVAAVIGVAIRGHQSYQSSDFHVKSPVPPKKPTGWSLGCGMMSTPLSTNLDAHCHQSYDGSKVG